MIATGWSNGRPTASGGGLGIRLTKADRDAYFDPGWRSVLIELPNGSAVRAPVSASFWRSCIELRSAEIGRWMLTEHLAPWPRGAPPSLRLEPIGPARFGLGDARFLVSRPCERQALDWMRDRLLIGGVVVLRQGHIPVDVTPSCHGAQMESTSGAVRYRRGIMRVVTPEAVAEQLGEVRRAAAAFGVEAVAGPLEQAAQEALAVARTEEDAELARQLVVVARRVTVRRNLRQ